MLTSELHLRSLANMARLRLTLNSTLWTGLSDEVQDVSSQSAINFFLHCDLNYFPVCCPLFCQTDADLGFQFRRPRELIHESSDEEKCTSSNQDASDLDNFDEADLLFGLLPSTTDLSNLHPQPIHIFKLWQTFLDNVNPLTNIIHAPTMQHSILEAAGDVKHVPRGFEALMFAIYAFAVTSLSPGDCESMFEEPKLSLLAKYRLGTQKALIRAEFLRSSDLVILQAFVLYLVGLIHLFNQSQSSAVCSHLQLSVRQIYDHRSLWAITGVAVRIGQRLGLHRDGTALGLSIFDSELRRRLWWQIVILDHRSAELSGSGTSVMAHLWDTKPPSNVNDSDLSPNMRESPVEHEGLTEMAFSMLRLEMSRFFRHPDVFNSFGGELQDTRSIAISLSEKDKVIDELERKIENKFVRRCDPMIPLHMLVAGVAKCVIYKLRLIAHHPRRYSDGLKSMPQSEKDMLFSNCLKMVEQDNLAHSNKSTQRFLWHIKVYFQLEALAYLLSDLCQRTTGEPVTKAWRQLDELFEHHPEMLIDTKNALFVAIQNLTIKAWKARDSAVERQNHDLAGTMLRPPRLISSLIARRAPPLTGLAVVLDAHHDSNVPPPAHLIEHRHIEGLHSSSDGSLNNVSNNYGLPTFSDTLQTDTSSMDWAYWDELLRASELQMFDGNG